MTLTAGVAANRAARPDGMGDVCAGGPDKFALADPVVHQCQTGAVRLMTSTGGRYLAALFTPKQGGARVVTSAIPSGGTLWQLGFSQLAAYQWRNVGQGGRLHAVSGGVTPDTPVQMAGPEAPDAPNWFLAPEPSGTVRISYWTSGLALAWLPPDPGQTGQVQLQMAASAPLASQSWWLVDVGGRRCQLRAPTDAVDGRPVRRFRPEEL